MYRETVEKFSTLAHKKANFVQSSPIGFFVAAMLAGAYVGLGIILIFTVGAEVDPSIRKLVMGTSFGIALTLVVFAGAELFTGHTMYMTLGWLSRKTGGLDLVRCWGLSWLGNLAGAAGLALLYAWGGGFMLKGGSELLYSIAAAKMGGSADVLLAKGILCNWLVCLALWMSARTDNDAAKCIVIFWCLFAFIASGFEHSVANMTIFSIALLGDHPDAISLSGMGHNLFWVTIGNAISGSLFVGGAYWMASPGTKKVE